MDDQIARRIRQVLQSKIDSGEVGGAIRRRRVVRRKPAGGVAKKGCRKRKVISGYKKKTGRKVKGYQRCATKKRVTKKRVVRRGKGMEDFEDIMGRGGARKKRVVKRKTTTKNPWIAYVKKFARAKGISYGEAMIKAGPSYRRLKK